MIPKSEYRLSEKIMLRKKLAPGCTGRKSRFRRRAMHANLKTARDKSGR